MNSLLILRGALLRLLPLILTLRALAQTPLTYDPGATQAGANVYTHPNTSAGAYSFSVVIPAGSVEGVRFRLSVAAGNADLYVKQSAVPTTGVYDFASTVPGSDLIGLSPSQYSAGQTWYILVNAAAGASWTLLAGDAAMTQAWDGGATQAGSSIYSHPDTGAGDFWFRSVVPAGSAEGMRVRLNVTAGNADVYVRQNSLPTAGAYDGRSILAGSDQVTMEPPNVTAAQVWFVMVRASAGASWDLLIGDGAVLLAWDPGTTDAGTSVYTHPTTAAGDFLFRIPAQASTKGGWRTALTVTSGTAQIYLRQTNFPTTTSYSYLSTYTSGGNGFVLRPDQYAAAQEWFILVRATTPASWSLVTGDIYVQDMGSLGFTDGNGNAQYDIGEAIIPGGSGAVSVGPEGMRFFRSTVPAGTPAWSLWLNGDTRDIAVRKTTAPFPVAAGYYDRKQAGQMLVVPPYLGTGSNVYFLSVTGAPGTAVNLDSRIQQVTDIGFNTTVANVNVSGPPYRVFRTTIPVDQIAWDVSTTANSGNPNVCVRKLNVPAEFDNDAFSEAAGAAKDSVSLVPDFLTNGTWLITVYGTGPYNFTLYSGDPSVTPIQYTDNKVNDETTRAGWRYYSLTDIPSQIGTLGWELLLSNHVPGSMIAIRRNKVPSRWQYRTGGSTSVSDTGTSYTDFSGSGGFLQRPGHQADIWYVGVFTAQAPLGAFVLDTHAIAPPTVAFDGSSTAVTALQPGRWKFHRMDVPAGVQGWDVRLRNLSGSGTPRMVVRRDQLPSQPASTGWIYPQVSPSWPSGNSVLGVGDWTGRLYDTGSPAFDPAGDGLVLAMGRPLEPGTYYVGVYNSHASQNLSCTVESRGIGAEQTIPVQTLSMNAGSSVAITGLPAREAAYFKVTVPPNTPAWEFTLTPTTGETMLALRRDTVPDFAAYFASHGLGGDVQHTAGSGQDRETEVQTTGGERYLLLPPEDQDYIVAGDYYIAVISEGVAPPATNVVGTGVCSAVLTSNGAPAVTNLGAATPAGTITPVSLSSAQVKGFQFTVPPGTASLEVRLDNRSGNPRMALIGGSRLPYPANSLCDFGCSNGELYPPAGAVSRLIDSDLITVANPPAGIYSLTVRADIVSNSYPPATADLVIVANAPAPLAFDGGTASRSGQVPTAWRYFEVTVPAGVTGWDIRVKNITGGDPRMAVRRDQLPASTANFGWIYPQTAESWPSGNAIGGTVDWTGRTYDAGAPTFVQPGQRLVTGMGRPLEPGTYIVGVYNQHATQAAAYTVESRGIGAGQTIPVSDLSIAPGSSAVISALPRREAAYFKVSVPASTPSWEFTLTPTAGEMMLAARRGTVPDFAASYYQSGPFGDLQATAAVSDRETEVQKTGPERYVLLPREDQDFLLPGDYYLAAISEGVNPPDNSTIGTGDSSGTLTSLGPLAITHLGTASLAGLTHSVTLAGAQVQAFQFTVPAGTASLEVRLDNRTGNPRLSMVSGSRVPQPSAAQSDFGYNNGEYYASPGGVNWLSDDNLITVPSPPPGLYSLAVRANLLNNAYPPATADIVIIANAPVPFDFDGGTASLSGVAPTAWRYFEVTVPPGVTGWDVRLKNPTSGDLRMAVRRGQIPASISNTGWIYPQLADSWPPGNSIGGAIDWTSRSYDAGAPNYPQPGNRLVLGMGRPLEPGTYYVGVYNQHGSQNGAATLESRGIGTGQTIPVVDLGFAAGSSAVITDLPRREAAYYKVTVTANTPAWEFTLTPTAGEMMLAARRGTVPDFWAYYYQSGVFGDLQATSASSDREMEVQKAGPERYLMLPPEDQDYLVAGDYYLAAVSEGVNPPDINTVGTGSSSGVLASLGSPSASDLGAATIAGVTVPVTLAGAQVKLFQFTVPEGTDNLEVRLDNRIGNPRMSLISGTRLPWPGNTQSDFGCNNGETSPPAGGAGRFSDDNVLVISNPPSGPYRLTVRADSVAAGYPNASADLIVRQLPRHRLNFDSTLNGNGFSHTDTRQLLDQQKFYYQVNVPSAIRGEPVVGWLLKVNLSQGDTTLRIYNTWGGTGGVTVSNNSALIVPPLLTLDTAWYVEVTAAGLTNYTITSLPVLLERNAWTMPLTHNAAFGDSGVDNGGTPLPGDRGIDIGQDDWHFYAVDVPAGNPGLLRTELQAINGNPNLYIREDGVPTTDHYASGNFGPSLIHHQLTAAQSEYGNWVPLNGRYENQLRPGRWYLAVKATGGTNARYRLLVSTGQVTDLPLSGGSATAQTLVGRDWRYYRFTVPLDAPLTWSLTFSQTVGDVVMFVRDSVPPGNGLDGNLTETQDFGTVYAYGLRTWAGDAKNQGPYNNAGHDAAGTYNFTTPPLRPAHTYYIGFRANNDATFNFSSAVSGGTVGTLPILDFYTGSIPATTLPGGSTQLYRIPAPPEGTRLKFSATHQLAVQLRLEQGSLPGTTGTQHWISGSSHVGGVSLFNTALNQTNGYPWQSNRDYYLRVTNTSASVLPFQLTMNGVNAVTEDEDTDGLPDAWERTYYTGLTFTSGTGDTDNDGSTAAQEFANGTSPTDSSSAKYTASLNAIHSAAGKSPNILLHDRATNVQLTNSADPGYTFLGWLRGERLDTQFAVRATGNITIPAAGTWTFGVKSRAGTRLTVNGVAVITDTTTYNDADTFAPVVFPAAGSYPVELIAFDYYGQADLELAAASGTHAAFNANFKLVGDSTGGGLAVPGGFTLRQVTASGSQVVNSLTIADSLLAGTIPSKGDLTLAQSVLNHRTVAGVEGNFPGGALFPLQQLLPVSPLTEPVLRNSTFHALNSIPLATALDTIGFSWINSGGDAPWIGENAATSFDTVDQAFTPPILDNQSAIIGITVEGPGVLTFRWKVSSQINADYLRLYQDTSQVQFISGDVPWTLATYNVPAGTHFMSWRYTKDGSTSAGSDRGWVDSVNWSPTRYTLTVNATGGTVTKNPDLVEYLPGTNVQLTAVPAPGNTFISYTGDLNTGGNPANINISANRTVTANFNTVGSGVDAHGQTWTLSSSTGILPANWFSQSTTTHDGVDAAQSGVINHGQYTQFQTTVTGPNPLTFWWKVSSEATNDPLRFLIDNVEQHRISGEQDWVQRTYNIAAGSHTLTWRYEKNASLTAGSDAAWVDEIIYGTNNYAGWRAANFTAGELANAAISGPNADPDNDGLTNPWECVLGLNPKFNDAFGPNDASVRAPKSTANPGFLELDFERVTNLPTDVTLQLYGAPGLTAWTLLSSKTGSAAWTVPAQISESAGGPGRTRVLARDNAPYATNPRRQIKVEISVP